MPRLSELFWQPARIEHIARHSITPEEVDEAVFGDQAGLLIRVVRMILHQYLRNPLTR